LSRTGFFMRFTGIVKPDEFTALPAPDHAAGGTEPGPVRLADLADKQEDVVVPAVPAVVGAVISGIGIEPDDVGAEYQSAAQQAMKQPARPFNPAGRSGCHQAACRRSHRPFPCQSLRKSGRIRHLLQLPSRPKACHLLRSGLLKTVL
jgi:hypothetical protein